ncbi:MBL fold metallo-hydrolase [Streptomyces cyaneofuscatus]|uniref:MBL fold metallo-hydrolase n=1 Tax=Streptomyces cyaneofuscatus TaxID=66883 RepID=UPI003F540A73
MSVVVNCHLHFDHIGGNPLLAGVPALVQETELAAARHSTRSVAGCLADSGSRGLGRSCLKPTRGAPRPGNPSGREHLRRWWRALNPCGRPTYRRMNPPWTDAP